MMKQKERKKKRKKIFLKGKKKKTLKNALKIMDLEECMTVRNGNRKSIGEIPMILWLKS